MSSGRRVVHTPLSYDELESVDIQSILTILVLILQTNPVMFNEILCMVAMGARGFRATLTTTPRGSQFIRESENLLIDALKEAQQ